MEIHENEDKKSKKEKAKGNAKDTLYRITLQNQINSLAIVDQKANIIIGINTILISIIMATVGIETRFVEFSFTTNIMLSLPFSIMLFFCVTSGIVSILVVRPTRNLWFKENASKLFFRNYKNLSLDRFISDMKEMTKDNENIYNALDIDIYLNGITIQRKYRLVRYAYILFMSGLVLAVFAFFILRLF